jgi:hypothetical protein
VQKRFGNARLTTIGDAAMKGKAYSATHCHIPGEDLMDLRGFCPGTRALPLFPRGEILPWALGNLSAIDWQISDNG